MIQRGSSGVPVRLRVPSTERKGAALSRAAAMMCNGAKFQRWVVSRVGAAPEGVSASQHAAQFVRDACGITSRAQLDHNAQAAALFHEAVRKPFVKWSGVYG
ncbi:hypothetical protein LMG26686_02802 [Achromobacter mucicolens]|uniref:hypothetical protein n=1 Tax=Achromobacter mucicolens TaxID=1389922 RepID=UPI00146874A9|nr:hypothetical protein [Achromobacter mucicolens]CAB3867843.1 hypothetical protein LMG26686_02802 [Achromobacter mucicolens]